MNTDDFDDAIRAHHAASLDRLSPRVRAQLQQRRRAALAGQAPREARSPWRFALPLAAACAVGALAIGLQLRAPDAPAPAVATAQPASTPAPAPRATTALPDTDEATASASLEENPELYVWLASDDAALMAMETSR